MDIRSLPELLGMLDALAVVLIFASWLCITVMVERTSARKPSVSVLMVKYRREWMQNLMQRETRVFDSTIIVSLRQSTAFYVSTSLIALGGGLAVIANIEQLSSVAVNLTLDQTPTIVWQTKLALALFFVANAFLSFVWSHRIFGYCSVMMGAVPNDTTDPDAVCRADQAADLNITAARAFNRGLRSIYFSLAALAWLIGSVALLFATAITVSVLYRREFASATRTTLLRSSK